MKRAKIKKQNLKAYDDPLHHREKHTPKSALKIMVNTFSTSMCSTIIDDTAHLLGQSPQERTFHSRECTTFGISSALHIHHQGFQDRRVAYAPS